MAARTQFLGANENYVFVAFMEEAESLEGVLPKVCVFDAKAWFDKDPHVGKDPIKIFAPTELDEDSYHIHFNEGIATGFMTPTGLEYRSPSLGFSYDSQRPKGFGISYLSTEENTDSKTKPEFIFGQLVFKQAFVEDKTFIKTEETSFNLSDEISKALKRDTRFKDMKLLKGLSEELFEVKTALSHNESKLIIALYHEKIELVVSIDLTALNVRVFTSNQIDSTIPNAKFSRELPYFVETTAEEIIFLEPTPFEYNMDNSTFNYLCYYYKFGDSKKRMRADLSATFITIQYDHPNTFPFRLLTVCNSYGIDIIAHDLINLQTPEGSEIPEQDTWASFYVMGLQNSTEVSSKPLIDKTLIFVRERQFVIEVVDNKPLLKPFSQ